MPSNSFRGSSSSGPLGGGNRGAPPNLAEFPNSPQYNLATLVLVVGVRAKTLYSWEKQLGFPQPQHSSDSGPVRKYTERDLVACLWLRDQILLGISPIQAAEMLLAAQSPSAEMDASAALLEHTRQTFPSLRHGLATDKLPAIDGSAGGRDPERVAEGLAALQESQTAAAPPVPPQATPWSTQQQTGTSGELRPIPMPIRPPVYSGPLRAPTTSGPLRPPPYTVPLNPPAAGGWQPPAPRVGPPSGPLRAGPATPQPGSVSSNSRWPIPPAPAGGRELRGLVQSLVRAFASFDTYTANRLLDEVLGTRTVEAACVGLLLPAMSRVGELSAHRQMTNPEQHFAANYVRGRLHAIFGATKERLDAPLAIITCAPHEMDDIGALTLATFWRRAGLRVVFLGQDTDGTDLVQESRKRRPQLVCVCISAPQRLRALARIAKGIMQAEDHAPIFAYSGAPFARNPELRRRVNGVYLGDDPGTATWHALRLLGGNQGGSFPPPPGAVGIGQVG